MTPTFVLSRLLQGLVVVLAAASLVFAAVRAVPGDPVDSILGDQALEADRDELTRCLRLDRSLPVQYALFVRDVADLSLGRFCDDPTRTVRHEIAAAIGPTTRLALASMLVALLVAMPLGAAAGLNPGRAPDRVALAVSTLGTALPVFCTGPLLLIAFALVVGSLPGSADVWFARAGFVLPALAIGVALSARLIRVTRAAVLDNSREQWVSAARARGLHPTVVALKHIVRNALVPVVTVAATQLGALLAGAVVAERVFARPGLGTLLLGAIEARNFALVQGCVIVIAAFCVLANLVADIATALVDPRVGGSRS